jgi:hypothetical protein
MGFIPKIGNPLNNIRRAVAKAAPKAIKNVVKQANSAAARAVNQSRSTFTAAKATARRALSKTTSTVTRQAAKARTAVATTARRATTTARSVAGAASAATRRTTRAATRTATSAARTVRTASTNVRQAAQKQVTRAQSAASRVTSRVSARVNNNPVAKAVRRGADFAKRNAGQGEPFKKLGESMKGTLEKAQTAGKDIRQAVKTRSLKDIAKAGMSTMDTIKSAGEVATKATDARKALRNIKNDIKKTFPNASARLANQYKKAASAASNVAKRTGLNRVATAAKKLTTRVANNNVAKTFRRVAGFSARSLGKAHSVADLGMKVKDLAGKTRTAASDIRNAVKTRSLADAGKALNSSFEAVKSAKEAITAAPAAGKALGGVKADFKKTFPKLSERLGNQYKKAANVAGSVAKRVGGERVKNAATKLIQRATQSPMGKALQRIPKNSRALGAAGNKLFAVASGIHGIATKAPGAIKDIRQAIKTRSTEDIGTALKSGKEVLSSVKDLAEAAPKTRKALKVLGTVAQRVAPKASAKVVSVASKVATKAGGKVLAKVATKVAGNSIAKAGVKALGKVGGRFAPGVNVAIAAVDTAAFVNKMRDPKASTASKVTSGVTALGSIAAATNIPVVSQVGAGVSMVSDIVGGFFSK